MENSTRLSSIPLPILTGENYESWSKKMKTFFLGQDLSYVTDGTDNYLEEDPEKKRKDVQALFAIQQAVADNIFPIIGEEKSAKEAWDKLKLEFDESTGMVHMDTTVEINEDLAVPLAMQMKEPYKAILNADWDAMADFFDKYPRIMHPMTIYNESSLHMAVYSRKERPLKRLLKSVEGSYLDACFETFYGDGLGKNLAGNTVLHEAATVGNFDAVKSLVMNKIKNMVMLDTKNTKGETPLFRAAAHGRNKIVKFLASMIDDKKWEEHRLQNDSTSILLIAVQAGKFDTAILLLKLDKEFLNFEANRDKTELLRLKDSNNKTVYDHLPDMPHAFKSGRTMDVLDKFLYHFMFAVEDDDFQLETATKDGLFSQFMSTSRKVLKEMSQWLWNFFHKERIWKEKIMHTCALKFVKLIIEDEINRLNSNTRRTQEENSNTGPTQVKSNTRRTREQNSQYQTRLSVLLFRAASTGIIEIVNEILEQCPQFIELLNDNGQNILHVAIMHRQRNIFDLVKQWPIALYRMNHIIDNDGYTLLHHVADKKHYTGGTKPSPAFQLQEELEWFEDVKQIIPPHLVMHRDKFEHKTAKELFKMNSKEELKEAQQWIKETSQSCSAVAVLVSTVVFAAIFTVPGDLDEHGIPRFINLPYFIVFTYLDVFSLACSLSAVIIFLSVLSSPFELEDFYRTLPRKLMVGFLLLFLSVVTTILTFTFTIILTFRFEKKWTRGLVFMAAFLPVLVNALSHFHWYRACLDIGVNLQCFEPAWHVTRKLFRRCNRLIRRMGLDSFQFGRKDTTPTLPSKPSRQDVIKDRVISIGDE